MKLGDVVLKRLNRALHRLQRQLGLRHGSLRARVRYEWGGDGAWACAKVWASLVGGNGHLLGLGCRTPLDRLDHSWDQRAAFCRRAKRRAFLISILGAIRQTVGDCRRFDSTKFEKLFDQSSGDLGVKTCAEGRFLPRERRAKKRWMESGKRRMHDAGAG